MAKVPLNVMVEPETKAWLKKESQRRKRSISNIVQLILDATQRSRKGDNLGDNPQTKGE